MDRDASRTPRTWTLDGRGMVYRPEGAGVDLNGAETLPLAADKIFVNTSTRPSVSPVEGLNDVSFLDNRSVMDLDRCTE